MEPMVKIKSNKCRHGSFSFPANDLYVGRSMDLYGEWSEGEVTMMSRLISPGDCVVEVGSNLGTHTVPLARMVGESGSVIAFEPQRMIFQLLCANLVNNGLTNVWAYNSAVGRATGTVTVPEIDLGATCNFGCIRVGSKNGTKTPIVTLDSLELEKIDLLKIDAEDYEPQVLLGAYETIERLLPPIFLEYNHHMREEINKVLRLFPYRAWTFDEPLFSPENYRKNTENVFDNTYSFNLLLSTDSIEGVTDTLQELSLE
ncbi:FkbM family methyltransferase [Serratia sp. UGAL515B_01]|uniref:FkbM family methyltransferase n=1 Tax=Serratia sp. UGAL515B_01 TaxID=2986763 RepID=UPI002953DDC7|nr:FkbM family methyltransferase [Serratia sp. UGAL515B_01]WON75835.1 FkbM family methyltransferase [Serratia sp. UGAL515B_01]